MPRLSIREWLRQALRFDPPAEVRERDSYVQFHRQAWQKLEADDPQIADQAVAACMRLLQDEMDASNRRDLIAAIEARPEDWVAPYHFGWGMAVRNYLRDQVCDDGRLPVMGGESDGNWDNFYSQAVEKAAGAIHAG